MIRHMLFMHVFIAFAVAICAAIPASIAVVLQSLWSALTSDLGMQATVQLVTGAMPTSFYMMAPIACVIATCWLFHANSESVAIQAMYAAGMSVFTCATPAILLALIATAATFVDAWVLAPRGVTLVENVKHQLRRNVSVAALREGQFHSFEFDDSVATMSFKRNLGDNRFEGFFVSVKPRAKHSFSISAKRAVVKKDLNNFEISFHEGTRVTLGSSNKLVVVAFNTYTHTFLLKGGSTGAKRKGKTILEMNFSELLALSQNTRARRKLVGIAKSELAKRIFLPVMNLSHALLAIGILFLIGPIQVKLKGTHVWVALGLTTMHVAAAAIIELVARLSFVVHGLIAAVILAELAIGIVLLIRSGRTVRELRWPRLVRRGGLAAQR